MRSRGLDIEVLTWGTQDDLVLVAAHGFLDCAEFFAPLAEALLARAELTVRAMSFAGHGGSGHADVYRWYDHVRDVLAVVADTRQRYPSAEVVLIGHSFGAVQLLDAARWLDPPPAAVINLDAPAGPGPGSGASLAQTALRAAESAPEDRTLPVYPGLDALGERRLAFNPRLRPGQLSELVPALARQVDGGWAWRVDPALAGWARPWELGWTEAPEPIALMRELSVPVLLITGAGQDHPQIRGAYPGDAALHGLRHLRLADAGHYVHLERTEAVADAVLELLT